ncbi:MAG: hypothetical protein AAF548_11975 [Actinomycetota bacterium]
MSRSRVVVLSLAALALVGAVGLYVQLRNTTTQVSEAAALARFAEVDASADAEEAALAVLEALGEVDAPAPKNADPEPGSAEATGTGTLPLPRPGVYRLDVVGEETIDLLTGAGHVYPGDGFLTVTRSDCGVDIRSDFIAERWQSISLCDGPLGPELVGEEIFHSFFGQEDLVVRICSESSIAAGIETWRCEGDTSVAVRSVSVERADRVVLDEERSVLVVTTSLLEGDKPGNVEDIEIWWDLETGLPVLERRAYDFTLDTPLGDAAYDEMYEAALTSLFPIN